MHNDSDSSSHGETPSRKALSRRAALRLGGSAAAVAGVATSAAVLGANPANAATGTMVYGTTMNSGTAKTELDSTHNYETMRLYNSGGGRALYANTGSATSAPCIVAQVSHPGADGNALYAENNGTGTAVFGAAFGGGPGVRGYSTVANAGVQGDDGGVGLGNGVVANVFNSANNSAALVASTIGGGSAVYAQINNASSGAATINAQTNGTGNAIYGTVGNPASSAPSIVGTHNGTGASVAGYAAGTGIGVSGTVANAASGAAAVQGVTIGTGPAVQAIGTRALDVQGVATFDRSGVVSIGYPNKSATVVVPGAVLTATSVVIATMQTGLTGVYISSATPVAGTNDVVITMSKKPGTATLPKTVSVAWLVIG